MRYRRSKIGKELYLYIAGASTFIRQFAIPNPFLSIGLPWAYALNFFIEIPLYMVSFKAVGLQYDRGTCPVCGALLYLLIYWVHSSLLKFIVELGLNWIIVVILLMTYAIIIQQLHYAKKGW